MLIKKNNQKGFTLVEVLVAVGILVMLIGGAVKMDSFSVWTSSSNRYKTQAIGLAQEGINAVRAIRDQNLLSDKEPFKDFPSECINTNTPCKVVEENNGTWKLYLGSDLDNLNGKDFTREITIEDL